MLNVNSSVNNILQNQTKGQSRGQIKGKGNQGYQVRTPTPSQPNPVGVYGWNQSAIPRPMSPSMAPKGKGGKPSAIYGWDQGTIFKPNSYSQFKGKGASSQNPATVYGWDQSAIQQKKGKGNFQKGRRGPPKSNDPSKVYGWAPTAIPRPDNMANQMKGKGMRNQPPHSVYGWNQSAIPRPMGPNNVKGLNGKGTGASSQDPSSVYGWSQTAIQRPKGMKGPGSVKGPPVRKPPVRGRVTSNTRSTKNVKGIVKGKSRDKSQPIDETVIQDLAAVSGELESQVGENNDNKVVLDISDSSDSESEVHISSNPEIGHNEITVESDSDSGDSGILEVTPDKQVENQTGHQVENQTGHQVENQVENHDGPPAAHQVVIDSDSEESDQDKANNTVKIEIVDDESDSDEEDDVEEDGENQITTDPNKSDETTENNQINHLEKEEPEDEQGTVKEQVEEPVEDTVDTSVTTDNENQGSIDTLGPDDLDCQKPNNDTNNENDNETRNETSNETNPPLKPHHPRPSGRAPKNKTWDYDEGCWIIKTK